MKSFNRMSVGALRQRGLTLLEVMAALVIAGVIAAVVLSQMDSAFSSSSATEELSNLNALYSNVRSLKTASGYGASGTDIVPVLVQAKGVPKNMNVSGGTLFNSFGGAVAIASTGNGFTVSYANTPQDACIKLVTKTSKSGIFSSTKVGGATAVTGEYTAAQAGTDCGATNSVVWTSLN